MRRHGRSWVFLVLIILFVVVVRVRLLGFPLERDEGEYAYMGQLMLQGISPYISAYNMKFPGTYAMYSLLMAVFGQSIQGIHFGFMLINCASIILVFLLSRKFISESAALTSGAAYALLSLSPTVLGFAAHATHFVVLPALGGVLVMLFALRNNRASAYFLSGVLFGLALLMKQSGLFFFLFGAAYILYYHFSLTRGSGSKTPLLFPPPVAIPLNLPSSPLNVRGEQRGGTNDRANASKGLVFKLGLFSAGGVAPLMMTVSFLYAVGAFDTFWFWTVEYASAYGAQIPLSGAFEAFKSGVSDVTKGFLFFWIMAISGFMVMFFYEGMKGRRVFIALFTFFSFLTICPGFYFRPHYFITLLPAVSILIGIIIDWLSFRSSAFFKTEYSKFIGVAVFIAATGAAIASERTYLFEESPVKLSRTVYGANPFPESLEIARFIESRSAKTDRVAVFGSEPQIYFYAKRHSATGYIYTYALMESHPYALRMQQEMIHEVESAEPKFIVVVKIATSWLMRSESEKYILRWLNGYIRDKYRLVGAVDIISSDMTIYKWDGDAQEYAIRSPFHVLIYEKSGN